MIKKVVFNTPYKTDHFSSVLFTEVSAGKQKSIRLPRFDITKYLKEAFCQTLTDISWSKIYQCPSANDMFNMFVYLLSSAVEKHALFENVFLKKKTPKLFKEIWFDGKYKSYYVNGSWLMKNTPRFHHTKKGLLIVNYDRNYRLS